MNDPPRTNVIRLTPARARTMILCNAVTRSGKPCKKAAVRGAGQCNTHLISPDAKIAAQERIAITHDRIVALMMEQVEPALQVIVEIMNNGAAREQDRMKAAELILDRTVGKKLEHSTDDRSGEKDLDEEIEEAVGTILQATGTDDSESWDGDDDE